LELRDGSTAAVGAPLRLQLGEELCPSLRVLGGLVCCLIRRTLGLPLLPLRALSHNHLKK
jgi:hypothetical protein